MSPLFSSLLSALIISTVSLFGLFFIFIKNKILSQITLSLVSFAIGALLGDAFIHLIPQSFEQLGFGLKTPLLILVGILIFFILEKILHWRHCHHPEIHHHHIVTLNIIGDSVHNFIDGALIAASFIVSPFVGITTSIAVLLHEIPQEIGDFGIMIHHGLSVGKAIFYNLMSGLLSLFGVIFIFLININFSSLLIPITAGGFIYLAATDLIPELHRHDPNFKQSLIQLICIILGISLMSILIFLE